jgi:hypothetical protein
MSACANKGSKMRIAASKERSPLRARGFCRSEPGDGLTRTPTPVACSVVSGSEPSSSVGR